MNKGPVPRTHDPVSPAPPLCRNHPLSASDSAGFGSGSLLQAWLCLPQLTLASDALHSLCGRYAQLSSGRDLPLPLAPSLRILSTVPQFPAESYCQDTHQPRLDLGSPWGENTSSKGLIMVYILHYFLASSSTGPPVLRHPDPRTCICLRGNTRTSDIILRFVSSPHK